MYVTCVYIPIYLSIHIYIYIYIYTCIHIFIHNIYYYLTCCLFIIFVVINLYVYSYIRRGSYTRYYRVTRPSLFGTDRAPFGTNIQIPPCTEHTVI